MIATHWIATRWIAIPLIALVALGACRDKPEEPKAKSSASASASISGNQPGMKIEVINPDINLKGDDFNIDGVKLYPGSTITKMNVETTSDTSKGEGKGKKSTVKVGFNSAANAKVVADWFDTEMKKAKFTTARSGYDISGQTPSGQQFILKIGDVGGGKSSGTVEITRNN